MKVYNANPADPLVASLTDNPIPAVTAAAVHPAAIHDATDLLSQVHDLDHLRTLSHSDKLDQAVNDAGCVLSAVIDAMNYGVAVAAVTSGVALADGIAAAACWAALRCPDQRVVIADLNAELSAATAQAVAPMPNVTYVGLGIVPPPCDDGRIASAADYADEAASCIDLVVSMHPDLVIARLGTFLIPADGAASRDYELARRCAIAELAVAVILDDVADPPPWVTNRRRGTLSSFARVLG